MDFSEEQLNLSLTLFSVNEVTKNLTSSRDAVSIERHLLHVHNSFKVVIVECF